MTRVLVIEDDLAVRRVFIASLQRAGYRVDDTNNSTHSVMLAQELQPDLILLDLELHGLNGWAILRQLKAHSLTQHIPIIGITTQSQLKRQHPTDVNGFSAILEKPFDLSSLLHWVAALTRSQATAADADTQLCCCG